MDFRFTYKKGYCPYCQKKLGIIGNHSFNPVKMISFSIQNGYLPYFCSTQHLDQWTEIFEKLKNKDLVLPKEFNFQDFQIEYKRKCNHCHKIWFVSLSEIMESSKSLKKHELKDRIITFATPALSSGSGAASEVIKKNLLDQEKCPECRSQNYEEEIKVFKKN